jgi:hypothetical protein
MLPFSNGRIFILNRSLFSVGAVTFAHLKPIRADKIEMKITEYDVFKKMAY